MTVQKGEMIWKKIYILKICVAQTFFVKPNDLWDN